jgi:hypothetical protein
MTNHTWADNAMRCAGARIKSLRPFEHYSWAHYRQQRERETLNALYDLYWGSVRRDFESGYSL